MSWKGVRNSLIGGKFGASLISGVLNAGLDCRNMRYIFRADIPSLLVHFIQEIGRIGRQLDATPKTDMVDVHVNLSGYVFLLHRLCCNLQKTEISEKEKKKIKKGRCEIMLIH